VFRAFLHASLNLRRRLFAFRILLTPAYPAKTYTLRLMKPGVGLRTLYSGERMFAAVILAALAPLLLLLVVAILVISRRGPLVRHGRVGWNGAPLGLLKLRTMWGTSSWETSPDSSRRQPFQWIEDVSGPVNTTKGSHDVRVISRLAAFCRRYSLDELPQFYHVARGEMSLVGPRPITRWELDTYYGPWAAEVLSARPGMTGLWQVRGRSHLNYSRRRRLDLILVRKASARFHLRILLRSVPVVINGDGAY
jgi:exopolysaccharide production protein ExoY